MGISNSNYVHSIEKHNCNVGPLNHFTIKFSKSIGRFVVVVVACYLLCILFFGQNLWVLNCINITFHYTHPDRIFQRIYPYYGCIYGCMNKMVMHVVAKICVTQSVICRCCHETLS